MERKKEISTHRKINAYRYAPKREMGSSKLSRCEKRKREIKTRAFSYLFVFLHTLFLKTYDVLRYGRDWLFQYVAFSTPLTLIHFRVGLPPWVTLSFWKTYVMSYIWVTLILVHLLKNILHEFIRHRIRFSDFQTL